MSSALLTSATIGTTCAPVSSAISEAALSSTSARRAHTTTLAPSLPRDCAAARPIPSLPPVTTATLPERPRSIFPPVVNSQRALQWYSEQLILPGLAPPCHSERSEESGEGPESSLRSE